MVNIVYIHGNGATADSFNFIRQNLPAYPSNFLEYDSNDGFYYNLRRMVKELEGLDRIFFVAHSLGGVYALHLANEMPDRVIGAASMSTPYGGSKAAEGLRYMLPFNQVLRDIQPFSPPIIKAKTLKILHPWTNIVTTRGKSPFMLEDNDGVVTRSSMRYRQDMRLVEVDCNHFEVVLSPAVVTTIAACIEEVCQATQEPANRLASV